MYFRATLVLKSCDFPAGAGSWQSVLRILHLYGKVDFRARAAKTPQTDAERKTILTDTRA